MIGLKNGIVQVIPYQPDWKEQFEEEAGILRKVLGIHQLQIEHAGSTAIQGMDAKPIIDIMVAVKNLEEAESLIPLIKTIGYTHREDDDIPGRIFFVKEVDEIHTHHLSLCELTGAHWKTHIQFRDYLSTHRETAEEYRQLKIELAKRFPQDRISYLAGKEDFIRKVIVLAESWFSNT